MQQLQNEATAPTAAGQLNFVGIGGDFPDIHSREGLTGELLTAGKGRENTVLSAVNRNGVNRSRGPLRESHIFRHAGAVPCPRISHTARDRFCDPIRRVSSPWGSPFRYRRGI